MISKITMFGFKGGAGYQLDRHDDKLFERYLLRAEKIEEEAHKKKLNEYKDVIQRKIDVRK